MNDYRGILNKGSWFTVKPEIIAAIIFSVLGIHGILAAIKFSILHVNQKIIKKN